MMLDDIQQVRHYEGADIIPNSLVNGCSECCREKMPDGSPNILGKIHRDSLTRGFGSPGSDGYFEILECDKCPVLKHAYETGEMWEIFAEIDGQE